MQNSGGRIFGELGMLDRRTFPIDGRWVPPLAAHDVPVVDPSTERPCATISLGADADADLAVAAAKRAFDTRSRTEPAERPTYERAVANAKAVAEAVRVDAADKNGKPRGIGSPFGGVKSSGRTRQGGIWGIEEFLEAKAISDWADAPAS